MQHYRNLPIPDSLADACHPDRLALVVHDMQVGVVGQIDDGAKVTERVGRVLEDARRAGVRVFFTRHMSLPTELMGISQLRTAMAWQRKERVEDVVSPFLRDTPGFEIVPELAPRESEAMFDKLAMSAFEAAARVRAARRADHRIRHRRRRDRGGNRAHRPPRRRPGPDSGPTDRRLRGRGLRRRRALARCARFCRRRDPNRHRHHHRPAGW
jgi:Isochorismatase family